MLVVEAFVGRGIPEDDILPRRNVFTYHAWKELGRQVRKGEHGVRLQVWITKPEETKDGKVTRKARTYPKYTTVFHISQTGSKDGAKKPETVSGTMARCARALMEPNDSREVVL